MKKLKKIKKVYLLGGILLIFSLLLATYGRYIYNGISDFYLSSKSFYFNSDKLTVDKAIYKIGNWSAVDAYPITINLNNHKNNLLHANSDISYEIEYECSSNLLCSVDSTGGILYQTSSLATFNAILTPNGIFKDGDEAWIDITVRSLEPYKKTLKGRFVLKVGKVGLTYEIDDKENRPYLYFRVTNTLDYYTVKENIEGHEAGARIDRKTYMALSESDKSKCLSALITLTFDPRIVILDMTNTAYQEAQSHTTTTIDGYEYVNSITFKMDSEASDMVRFYKANTSLDYTYPIINEESVVDFSYST